MADTKISALTSTTTIGATDVFTTVQGGVNKKIAYSDVLAVLLADLVDDAIVDGEANAPSQNAVFDALALKQDLIDGLAIPTATVAVDDKALIQDLSDADNLKTVTTQAIANLRVLASTDITGQTETTDVDQGDFILLQDTSASGLRKALVGNVKQSDLNVQTGTTYTLLLADAGKHVTLNNVSAITLTVPLNASVAFPIGTVIHLSQLGAGQVTLTSSATIRAFASSLKLAGQYASVTLTKLGTDEWLLSGNLA